MAYAHFKAAILADPAYAAPYGNLAQLYLRAGFSADAERLLGYAVALDNHSDLALGTLHQLLLAQGRDAEASRYARQLQVRRDSDPYYWLGLGIEHLRLDRPAQAAAALERARALTTGFEEVHTHLAIAYWRVGKPHMARDQLAVLSALDRNDPNVAALSQKFKTRPDSVQPQ